MRRKTKQRTKENRKILKEKKRPTNNFAVLKGIKLKTRKKRGC